MKLVNKSTFDTIVVPARKEGFDRVFIGEDRWYAIKFSEAMQKQIKYIAGYQVKPISKITHSKKYCPFFFLSRFFPRINYNFIIIN